MNPTQDEAFRHLAADAMAQGFITEILLTQYLKGFPPSLRQPIADTILKAGAMIDPDGRAPSEELAEMHADVTVKMQAHLASYVQRALARLQAGELALVP